MDTSKLIENIYEAAFVPDRWQSVLNDLLIVSGSASASILVFKKGLRPSGATTARTHSVFERFLNTDAWSKSQRDPAKLHAAAVHGSYFSYVDELLEPAQLERDTVHSLLEEAGVAWQIATVIPMPTNGHVVFTFERNKADGPHNISNIAQLIALRPHLARTGLLAARLGMERARGALEAMTKLGLPAALIDNLGRIRDANTLMTPQLIGTGGHDRVILDNQALDAALAAILDGGSKHRSMVLPPTRNRPGRVAHVIPLSGPVHAIFTERLSLLVINVADGTIQKPDWTILRALFDLTPAESRLAAMLASGSNLAESAKACGIRIATARSYLEMIFKKTGVRRQAELSALIVGSVGLKVRDS